MGKVFAECEKLSGCRDQVDELMGFLKFLNKKGIYFGKVFSGDNNPWLTPVNLEREGEVVAAEFLGVDMALVDLEREELARSVCLRGEQ